MIKLQWLMYLIVNWLIIATLINCLLMGVPIPKFSIKSHPTKYIITKNNRIDIQKNNECSAFSTAYLMRHFGIQISGEDIYKTMPNKLRDGCVYPKGIIKFFAQKGFKATYCIGNISLLKYEISKDVPVIVFIKTYCNKSYLHFVTVVGYDEENLYIAESLENFINANDIYYNRKISITEFQKLWNTSNLRMPFYKNTYIIVINNIK